MSDAGLIASRCIKGTRRACRLAGTLLGAMDAEVDGCGCTALKGRDAPRAGLVGIDRVVSLRSRERFTFDRLEAFDDLTGGRFPDFAGGNWLLSATKSVLAQ